MGVGTMSSELSVNYTTQHWRGSVLPPSSVSLLTVPDILFMVQVYVQYMDTFKFLYIILKV